MACLEHQNMWAWEARSLNKRKNFRGDTIPDLARDLAFMIIHDLSGEENTGDTGEKITSKSWQGFKHFSEALEAYNLYNISSDTGYLEQARNECLKAVYSEKGYEKLSKLLYNLGMIYSKKKELSKAEELIFLAHEIKPDDDSTLVGLGYLYGIQYQYQKALGYFKRATDANPKSDAAWFNKGWALFYLGRTQEALEACEKAITINPEYALAWGSKGGTLIKLGRMQEALEACEKAISIDQNLAMAWSNKCVALDSLGRTQEALETRKRAAELKLKHSAIYIPLARLYREEGHEVECTEMCQLTHRWIENEKEYNRACFEAVCGSPDTALDLLRTALENKEQTADWARQDPDFEFIRDDPEYKERFEDLLDEFSTSEKKGPN